MDISVWSESLLWAPGEGLPHAENGLRRLSSRAWVGVKEDSRSIFCDHGTVLSPGKKPFHSFHPIRRAGVHVAKRCLENTRQGSRGPRRSWSPRTRERGRGREEGPGGARMGQRGGEPAPLREKPAGGKAGGVTRGNRDWSPGGGRRESPEALQVMRFKKERMLETTFPKSTANGVRPEAREALRSRQRLLRSRGL